MTAGRFGQETLLSAKALRIYADSGLLPPRWVDPSNGYRYYGDEQVRTGWLIALLRSADLSLEEIADIVGAPATERTGSPRTGGRRRSATGRGQPVRARPSAAPPARGVHHDRSVHPRRERPGRAQCAAPDAARRDGPGDQRRGQTPAGDRPGRRADRHRRRVRHLPRPDHRRVRRAAGDRRPGRRAARSDAGPADAGDLRSYRLAGGHVAERHAEGRETYFPDILALYDEVHTWITDSGRTPVGPPREIWHNAPADPEPLRLTISWPYATV